MSHEDIGIAVREALTERNIDPDGNAVLAATAMNGLYALRDPERLIHTMMNGKLEELIDEVSGLVMQLAKRLDVNFEDLKAAGIAIDETLRARAAKHREEQEQEAEDGGAE